MKTPEYCFLRHGETAFNKAGILHGQLDSDLTELGKSQAIQQANSLKKINFPGPGSYESAKYITRTKGPEYSFGSQNVFDFGHLV